MSSKNAYFAHTIRTEKQKHFYHHATGARNSTELKTECLSGMGRVVNVDVKVMQIAENPEKKYTGKLLRKLRKRNGVSKPII